MSVDNGWLVQELIRKLDTYPGIKRGDDYMTTVHQLKRDLSKAFTTGSVKEVDTCLKGLGMCPSSRRLIERDIFFIGNLTGS